MPHPITTAALILGSAFIASPAVTAAPETATAQRINVAPATVTATQMQRPARRPPPTVQALTRRIEALEGQLRQLLSVITIDEDGAVIRARNLSFEGEQLKLEAMRVSVEAGTGLTLETGENLTASSGGNLYLKGNAVATLDGGAVARLRSAGQARVEGSDGAARIGQRHEAGGAGRQPDPLAADRRHRARADGQPHRHGEITLLLY